MTNPANEAQAPLTKEETAWLMKTLWAALQAPNWADGNKKDLSKLGEALLSGKTLKELPDDLLGRIFPNLKTVTLHLGAALKARAYENDAAPAPAQAPAPTTSTNEQPETPRLSVVESEEPPTAAGSGET